MMLTWEFTDNNGLAIRLNAINAGTGDKILMDDILEGKYGPPKILSGKTREGKASELIIGFSSAPDDSAGFLFPESFINWKSGEKTVSEIFNQLPEDKPKDWPEDKRFEMIPYPSERHKLWFNCTNFGRIANYEPKLIIERYTRTRKRGTDGNATQSGWRKVPNRINEIPLTTPRQEIEFDPENYFRANYDWNSGYVRVRARAGTKEGVYCETKIQFRILINAGGKEMMSLPFERLKIMALSNKPEMIRINYKLI